MTSVACDSYCLCIFPYKYKFRTYTYVQTKSLPSSLIKNESATIRNPVVGTFLQVEKFHSNKYLTQKPSYPQILSTSDLSNEVNLDVARSRNSSKILIPHININSLRKNLKCLRKLSKLKSILY